MTAEEQAVLEFLNERDADRCPDCGEDPDYLGTYRCCCSGYDGPLYEEPLY